MRLHHACTEPSVFPSHPHLDLQLAISITLSVIYQFLCTYLFTVYCDVFATWHIVVVCIMTCLAESIPGHKVFQFYKQHY